MSANRYKIVIERIAEANAEKLEFEVESHDEVIGLVKNVQSRGDLEPQTAAALTVGMTLLGEVLLQNRSRPLFADFLPQFSQFIKRFKSGE